MAKAIRRAKKQKISLAEVIANEAEVLAKDRFDLEINGSNYLTTVDGELSIDVAKMYETMLK